MKKIIFGLLFIILNIHFIFPQTIKGKITDENGEPMVSATVLIKEINKGILTDSDGKFRFGHLPKKQLTLIASFVGYNTITETVDLSEKEDVILHLTMHSNLQLNEIEVFGERHKQPEKLESITRMPLRPSEQIQSISVISDKVIAEQGALSITDAMRNVPGVTLFGSYGGVKESMSSRGYRGIPVLKNGVRMDSQYQTASGITDMQGVESIQMIKGSAAITQGITTDLGNAGGVINVVTKTPKFVNGGEVTFRAGSWGQIRPTFDVQTVLDNKKTTAIRLTGAYERADNYRPVVSSDKVYINPSFEWRPDDKTTVTLELDYLNSNVTPVTSTVNLADIDTEALYKMPYDKFLGFANDNNNTRLMTYSGRLLRKLTDNFSIRAAYFNSSYNVDNTSTSVSTVVNKKFEDRARIISRSLRDDKNTAFQLDFIGKDVYTGKIKHTFQLGFDYRTANAWTKNLGSITVDTINVLSDHINNSRQEVSFSNTESILPATTKYSTYGIMGQEVVTFNKYLKAILGLRYSFISSINETTSSQKVPNGTSDAGATTGDAIDPMMGVMISPIENVNIFGSYTTSTSLRNAAFILTDSITKAGASKTNQLEVGFKSDWLNNRLRFNFTYFHIITENLTNAAYIEGTDIKTDYYFKAGDLKRDGIEVELNGRIMPNLQVMLGYAYLHARYANSPSYVNGSAPMNAPKHTANGWAYYTLNSSPLKGLAIGIGAYYVGDRPVNEYSLTPDGHGTPVGKKPFDMPAYTTVNAQLAYAYKKVTARVFVNNIFDELGYNSYYRGGYINQIDPRNFAATVSYQF